MIVRLSALSKSKIPVPKLIRPRTSTEGTRSPCRGAANAVGFTEPSSRYFGAEDTDSTVPWRAAWVATTPTEGGDPLPASRRLASERSVVAYRRNVCRDPVLVSSLFPGNVSRSSASPSAFRHRSPRVVISWDEHLRAQPRKHKTRLPRSRGRPDG